MLELNKGIDIAREIGGVADLPAARQVLKDARAQAQLKRR
jgi:hypothetical protein